MRFLEFLRSELGGLGLSNLRLGFGNSGGTETVGPSTDPLTIEDGTTPLTIEDGTTGLTLEG